MSRVGRTESRERQRERKSRVDGVELMKTRRRGGGGGEGEGLTSVLETGIGPRGRGGDCLHSKSE